MAKKTKALTNEGTAVMTPLASLKIQRRSKYRATPITVDSIRFASKREATAYSTLKLLAGQKKIFGLEMQPRFPLEVNGELVGTYVADFKFKATPHSKAIILDIKGMKTPVYKLKKKLAEAIHKIQVLEEWNGIK